MRRELVPRPNTVYVTARQSCLPRDLSGLALFRLDHPGVMGTAPSSLWLIGSGICCIYRIHSTHCKCVSHMFRCLTPRIFQHLQPLQFTRAIGLCTRALRVRLCMPQVFT